MASPQDFALRYANESGFPFQMAVQHAVESCKRDTPWTVRYSEHGWVHPATGASGFIDLVLAAHNSRQFFVVECKRRLDAHWVFMHSSGGVSNRRHAKAWVTEASGTLVSRHDWTDVYLNPDCPEANFCAARGKQGDDEGLIETEGAKLVLATEALANEHRDYRQPGIPYTLVYAPLIVTTASLWLADIVPGTVGLHDGRATSANVRPTGWVRFRKQLATRHRTLTSADRAEGGDPSYQFEHSIFVVNAGSLLEFLKTAEFSWR